MPAADDYIGKTVAGRYRIESMLGEGGMGKVYKANQIALDKPIVLKVLRQALLSDQRTVARFQREAKAASRLNHPNSISVIDFGQAEDGALYMAMEYVSGKDLHHILSREWPLPEARVIRIVSQVLSALSDAHKAGVIHRDLKPENIMVEQRRGEPDFVKVLDFGIAKIMDSSGEEGPALTRAGFVCGTPEYMSPEQARGAQLDPRSDLYAVGVILYQLTSGLLPFDSDSAVGFATKHLTEQPVTPTRRRPEARITQGLERVIMKSLCKDPNDRPQTAEAFRAELLALDKERRSSVQSPRRTTASGNVAPSVLQSPPRKVTPLDQQQTRIGSNPGWGTETTQRQDVTHHHRPEPTALVRGNGAAGPVLSPSDGLAFEPNTAPERRRNPVEITDQVVAPSSRGTILKVATIVLVVAALAIGGAWVWRLTQPPKIEPVTPDQTDPRITQPSRPQRPTGPLYELIVLEDKRDPVGASRLDDEADAAWHTGNQEQALEKYLDAWVLAPSPELALKIGEIYYQRDETRQAEQWWLRHLKDSPNSRAAVYINSVLPH